MAVYPSYCLQGTGLSCIRDDRLLFEGLDFFLSQGQVLLLEGKNGSGKTSLLRILCGFREPDSGQVTWCGENVNGSHYYSDMAYVGHLDGVKKELTVVENLKLSLALGVPGHCSIQQALERVGLAGYDDALVQTLSAGQQRRLSLARLLITKNILWILDEPFTSLDKHGIAVVEALIAGHCQNAGMVVLTSHHQTALAGIDVQRVLLS